MNLIIAMSRLSFFGSFEGLKPTTESAIGWMQKLQRQGYHMLPNVVTPFEVVPSDDSHEFSRFSEKIGWETLASRILMKQELSTLLTVPLPTVRI